MRRMIILSFAIVVALVLALASFAGASPGTDENGALSISVPEAYKGLVEIRENGWVAFNTQPEYALENAKIYTKEGERAPGGACVFSGELVLPAGKQAVEERGTAINPSTCQMHMERGTPPASAIADEVDQTISSQGSTKSSEQQSTPRSTSNNSGGDVSIAATYRSAGLHRTWWEDPAHIDVNLVHLHYDCAG